MNQDEKLMVAEISKSLKQHMDSISNAVDGAIHDLHTLDLVLKIEPSNSNSLKNIEREQKTPQKSHCDCED